MSSTYSTLAAAAAGKTVRTPDPCTPCPECGGLECMCRPRFFAGQLLTEADLNRLDHYIVGKNRLHNRYLHAWGVACGLEVVCHPCGNQVIVKTGYALSPCGDDIVLCADQTVDICQLISGCCRPEPDDCFPPRPVPPECDEVEQQWILAVCYDEQLSRGVPALRATNACAPKCGCGSQGGCGCGSKGSACSCGSTKSAASLKPSPTQCEPVTVCEAFRFVAYPAPVQDRQQPRGAMFDRFLACLSGLAAAIPAPPTGSNLTLTAAQKWCVDLRRALIDLFRQSSGTSCAALEKLNVTCPPVTAGVPPQQYINQVVQHLGPILIEYLRGCLCSALLPPCPEPALANCVPLATITLRPKNCQILRICNLEGRKFLTTFPNLAYWLSWLPYVRNLRNALARVCCSIIEPRANNLTTGLKTDFSRSRLATAPPDTDSGTLSAIAFASFSRYRTSAPSGIEAVAYAAMGLNDANGNPYLKSVDLQNPLAAAMADELMTPVLAAVFPPEAIAAFTKAGADRAADEVVHERQQDTQLESLLERINTLQQTVDKQQMTIDGLVRALRQKERKDS